MLLPVSGGADVDPPGLASGLELVSKGDVVAEQTVSRHLDSDDSGENRTRVDPDPHLQQRVDCHLNLNISYAEMTIANPTDTNENDKSPKLRGPLTPF